MSSKGAITRAFRGFSLIEYINVGRVGPGYDREAQAFQRAQAEADRAIQGAAPVLQRTLEHYANGDHAYRRHRTLLDRDRDAELSHESCPQLQLPDSLGESRFGFRFTLFLKPGVPPVLVDKVLADFHLSQLAGGPLRPYLEGPGDRLYSHDGTLADRLVQDLALPYGNHASPAHALSVALAREQDLRALARKGPPFPRLAALLLSSAIDRAPVPQAAFDLMKKFSEKEAASPALAILRFLPDAQWDEGVARLRAFLGSVDGLG
jgi:hypothetical protein